MEEPATITLNLRFYKSEGSEPPTHHIKVLEQTKLSQIVKTVTYGYSRNGYSADEFELYLVKPGQDRVMLDLAKRLSDYGTIKDHDDVEIRRKAVPISLSVNLHSRNTQSMQVNAALPAVEATSQICQMLGIQHSEELSLAVPKMDTKGLQRGLKVHWLDSTTSLAAQDVKDGHRLLLRKKFYVKNEDVDEAVEGNHLLLELLYHQLHTSYMDECGIPASLDMATVSSLLHHIEQEEENISDESAMKLVVPETFQNNTELYEKVVEAYYRNRVHSMKKQEAKCQLLKHMCQPSTTTAYFPVKHLGDGEEYVLAIDSIAVSLCSEKEGRLTPCREWPLKLITKWEGTEDHFKFVAQEEWNTLHTVYAMHIAQYLSDILLLVSGQPLTAPVNDFPEPEGHVLDLSVLGVDNDGLSDTSSLERSPERPAIKHRHTLEPAIHLEEEITVTTPACVAKPDVIVVSFPETYTPRVLVEVKEEEPEKTKRVNIVTTLETTEKAKHRKARALERMQSYLEIGHEQLLLEYRLFHFVILQKDIRALLINITHTVDEIVFKVCATYGISNPDSYHLWIPKGLEMIIEKHGGKLKSGIGKFIKGSVRGAVRPRLDGSKSLAEQFDFSIKPYILNLDRHAPGEEVDTDDSLEDVGEEWPDFEEPSIARQREFHQCWCGVVQGDYPVDQQTAIQLAALLTQIYYGDRLKQNWPITIYRVEHFLPSIYKKSPVVTKAVAEAHAKLAGKDKTEAMEEVIDICHNRLTYEGIFFDVEVPVSVLPWKRVKHRKFGINHQGVMSVNPKTGKILFVHRFSDIHDGSGGNDIVHLNFRHWDSDYYAHTYQAKEIMAILQIFIGMTKRGQIEQAPSFPPNKRAVVS